MREPIKSATINGTTFENVPQRLNFAATDSDGIIYGHESVPKHDHQEFAAECRRKHYIDQTEPTDWKNSLVGI